MSNVRKEFSLKKPNYGMRPSERRFNESDGNGTIGYLALLLIAGGIKCFWDYVKDNNQTANTIKKDNNKSQNRQSETRVRGEVDKTLIETRGDCKLKEIDAKADADIKVLNAKTDNAIKRVKELDKVRKELKQGMPKSQVNALNDKWIEQFDATHAMPPLPWFFKSIMQGVPTGYETPILLSLTTMSAALCFSKVRAKYTDGKDHAPNLGFIAEGGSGQGKGKIIDAGKCVFQDIIKRDEKMTDTGGIVQVAGLGTSWAKFFDNLATNKGVHTFAYDPECSTLLNNRKRDNNFMTDEVIRKAFDNDSVYQNNKAKDGVNGFFSVYLNYVITGTPEAIQKLMPDYLVEGGSANRLMWSVIPTVGRFIPKLELPEGDELAKLRNQVMVWNERYCHHIDPTTGEDVAADEVFINLDYVIEALEDWINVTQWNLYQQDQNETRKDVRPRIAAIAFHCAIVFHMLWAENSPQKFPRKRVIDLTLYVADYCMERYLFKFGDYKGQVGCNAESTSTPKPIITPEMAAEMKALHDLPDVDERGNKVWGWGRIATKFGIPNKIAVKRAVEKLEEAE